MTAPPDGCRGRESGRKDNVEDQTRHAPSVASPALSGQPNEADDDNQPSDAAGQDAGDEPAVSATDEARQQMVTSPSPTAPSEGENPEDGVYSSAALEDTCSPEADPMHRDVDDTPRSLLDDQQSFGSVRRKRNLSWLGDVSPRSSVVMEGADHLSALINVAKKGDRDPLTTAETIMLVFDIPLTEIVSRGLGWVEQRLREGLPRRHTGEIRTITKPESAARRIFYALGRLKAAHPADRMLPEIHVTKAAPKLSPMRLDAEPKNLKDDLRRWGLLSRQERGRETGEGRALDDSTRHTYVENVRLMASAANELGLINAAFSVGTLASSDVAEKVLDYLDRLYTPSVVAAMVASLARIAIDLFSDDPEHEADIDHLQAEAKDRFPDQALSENARKRYDGLTSDPLKMSTIMDAPAAMMARAYAPSLKPIDRVGRAARAIVAQLKLESPALEATQAAELDADVHLRREGSVLLLRLPDPRERGRFRWDQCTPAAEALLTEWLELKDEHGIAGSLFFPSEGDPAKPQIPRVAMAGLYADFKLVTGEHLTFDEIKTLRCYKAIKAHPEKMRHISEAAGYKDPRSLGRRLGIFLTRRRGGRAA